MTGVRHSASRTAVLVGAAVLSFAGLARGGGDPAIDDAWLSARIVNLGDADFRVRERATDEINQRTLEWTEELKAEVGADATLTDAERELKVRKGVEARTRAWMDEIEARLAGTVSAQPSQDQHVRPSDVQADVNRAELNKEQRERLMQIGTRLFSSVPHGAMGVKFSRLDRGQGVEISGVIAGFDSQRVLQPADIVLDIDGHEVNAQTDMRAAIISHDPGDKVDMTLLRRGERVVVALQLGDLDNLQNAAIPDHSLMRDAFELRVARRAGVAPDRGGVIDPGMDSAQWASLQLGQNERMAALQQQARGRNVDSGDEDDSKTPSIVAGGADRLANGGDTAFLANPNVADQNQIETLQRNRQTLELQYQGLIRRLSVARDPRSQTIITNQIRAIQAQIGQVDRALSRAGVVRPQMVPGMRRNMVKP
ncbi:MAG: PDZ domain-containing protein [Tepidisphaera sp.]|nr:PDZ domain-containing protein [Tepidisphaera sp.]